MCKNVTSKKFSVQFEKICMNWPINPSQSCSNIFGKFVYSSLLKKKSFSEQIVAFLLCYVLTRYTYYIFAIGVPLGFYVNICRQAGIPSTLNWF